MSTVFWHSSSQAVPSCFLASESFQPSSFSSSKKWPYDWLASGQGNGEYEGKEEVRGRLNVWKSLCWELVYYFSILLCVCVFSSLPHSLGSFQSSDNLILSLCHLVFFLWPYLKSLGIIIQGNYPSAQLGVHLQRLVLRKCSAHRTHSEKHFYLTLLLTP